MLPGPQARLQDNSTRRGGTKKKPREVSYRGLGSKLMRVCIGCPNRGESVAARAERFG